MPYTVKYKGLDVQCDSIEEIDQLASSLSGRNGSSGVSAASGTTADRLTAFVKALRPRHRQVLLAIAKSTTPVSADKLVELAGVEQGEIRGVMGGLTRIAKNNGLEKLIVRDFRRNGTGKRHYEYSIDGEIVEEVRKVSAEMK